MKNSFAVGVALLLAGCATAINPPDLGKLYNRSAMYHGPDRNPVIVIPGILGSKLMDKDSGRTVWGAFAGDYANPQTQAGAQLCALPMKPGVPLEDLRDAVHSTDALDRLKISLFGIPLKLSAYANILGSLGVGGYRDQQLAMADAVDYGTDHFTCFQFHYDWRRSSVENAQLLHAFIKEKKTYVEADYAKRYGMLDTEVRFDIVAHSMGGLITRYFLRYGSADLPEEGLPALTWDGADYVDTAVLIGTPNAGSALGIMQLLEGLKPAPTFPLYEPAVLGTLPAIYELMPRPRHGAMVDSRDPRISINFMDPGVWEKHGWGLAAPLQDRVLKQLLPDVRDGSQRRKIALDHMRKCLHRADQFHAALDVPATPPDGVDIHLIAADSVPTLSTLAVDVETGHVAHLSEAPGDGTVPRTSALMDERVGGRWSPTLISPIDWSQVTFIFNSHIGMTKDPVFADNILYLLLEAPRD